MHQVTIFESLERPRCVVPDPQTQQGRLLRALQRGMRPTIITAGPVLGVGALSQRIGELRKMKWDIKDKRVPGKPYHEYWLEGAEPDAA